jgi:hypothetical protein
MLPTIALCFIRFIWSTVTTSLLPVTGGGERVSGLVEFLRARYAEHRATAEAAAELQYDPENGWGIIDPSGYATTEKRRWISPHIGMLHEPQSAEHIVANNPAVVLADLDAKLRIMKVHERLPDGEFCVACNAPAGIPGEPYGCATLRLLASPYADHPDYREEWKP